MYDNFIQLTQAYDIFNAIGLPDINAQFPLDIDESYNQFNNILVKDYSKTLGILIQESLVMKKNESEDFNQQQIHNQLNFQISIQCFQEQIQHLQDQLTPMVSIQNSAKSIYSSEKDLKISENVVEYSCDSQFQNKKVQIEIDNTDKSKDSQNLTTELDNLSSNIRNQQSLQINEMLDDLFNENSRSSADKQPIKSNCSSSGKPIKQRKPYAAYETLQQYYEKNPNWSKQFIYHLASQLNLSYKKIYKWNWDRKKRDKIDVNTTQNAPRVLLHPHE
ncbi:UNKNOWN [Stylonychia lemnae]|uniref:Homeobox domain-containing protein n=1 Tax=Stylonychia lemnae TaxID=5949 RepID=A0A077ZX01_STYLE|nr:UNKNOWN [Stylonychia lemnae]|eukprot:CDW74395.1 UNKNOWN [Stylonychia lemnae]